MRSMRLGIHGPMVSVLGFGAMVLSPGVYNPVNDEQSLATLQRALEIGITLIDTADIYGVGQNEMLVGRAISGRRKDVVLATKFGGYVDESGKLVQGLGRRAYVQRACDASLKRLGTDYIDLYYLQRVDPTTPIEETVGAMAELVKAGKVRYIGLSEAGPETIRRAHHVSPITAVETEYSLFTRNPEAEILPTCRELGIGFVAYSPLGRGFLGGNLRKPEDLPEGDWRRTLPRFQGENFFKNVQLADKVSQIAKTSGIAPAQLALAWLIQQGVVPIPGSRSTTNLQQNAEAAQLTLNDEELSQLDALTEEGAVAGHRADAGYLGNVNR